MGLRSVAQSVIVPKAVGMFPVHCVTRTISEKLGNGLSCLVRGTNPGFEKYSLCMRILE
jgi:hypothetical protein